MHRILNLIVFISLILTLTACGKSNNDVTSPAATLPDIVTVGPGATYTMAANSSIKVPSGATVTSNGIVIHINGSGHTINTAVGEMVSVPPSATGEADNTIIANSKTTDNITPSNITVIAGSSTQKGEPIDSDINKGIEPVFWGGGKLAVDRDGNVILSDHGLLRKVLTKPDVVGTVITLNNTISGLKKSIYGIAVYINPKPDPNKPKNDTIYTSGNEYNGFWNAFIQNITMSGTVSDFAIYWRTTYDYSIYGNGGLAADSKGNIIIADDINNQLIKFSSAGEMSVFAGYGGPGYQDGYCMSAKFNRPTDLLIDGNDNLFVIDTGNAAIRMITPGGKVTTVVSNLQFSDEKPIAVDSSGNLYIINSEKTLMKIDMTGNTTSYSLTGISDPITGLVFDKNGNLFVGTRGVGAQIIKIVF